MSGSQTPETNTSPNPVLDGLFEYRKLVVYGLLGLALILAIVMVIGLIWQGGLILSPLFILWLVLIPVALVGGLVGHVQIEQPTPASKDRFRITLITVGGLFGLALALYGLALPF